MPKASLLCIVIPCYNEEAVLPQSHSLFLQKLNELIQAGKVDENSRILFVDDGSTDKTWHIISELAAANEHIEGVRLSRNRGHQNALLAGLMTAKDFADITITIDCDGQDDVNAMDEMLAEYENGCDIVYGVRSNRDSDSRFKRGSAQLFYRFMKKMGVDMVYNHADYRLMSKRALDGLAQFKEVNMFLRGLVPLVGYRYCSVYYERHERIAGETHYPLQKMIAFALDGITSLSVKPIRLITWLGVLFALLSFAAIVIVFIQHFVGKTVAGWSSTVCAIFFIGGIQLLAIGIIGEYIGKIYSETKQRPRFIISEKTLAQTENGEET